MKAKVSMLVALLSLAVTAMGATYYVNPSTDPVTGGNDAWDGTCEVWEGGESLHGPKRTLVGVMEVATSSGDVVIALPGVYSEGLATTGTADQYTRVSVPAGVTLKSKYGAKATIIMGKAAGTPADGCYGCGTGSPARCAVLGNNSKLEGFTLTGGRTLTTLNGGGVSSASSSSVSYCIISNNVANRSAAVQAGRYFGCKFLYNRALDSSNGNIAYSAAATFVNCFFDCNPSLEPLGAEFYTGADARRMTAINCTFGPHLNQLYGGSKGGIDLYNCIDLSANGAQKGVYNNSAYLTKHKSVTSVDETSFKTTVAAMSVGDDGSLGASSGAINQGSNDFYNNNVPSVLNDYKGCDIAGGGRVQDETIDLGCFEYDPNPHHWYVDDTTGFDLNSGRSAEQAFKTLAAAGRADWMRSGDVVHVAPGTYDDGVNDESEATRCRVRVPAGVTLKSTAGAAETIIKGAASTDEHATEYGNGANAVRCVVMEAGARVEGFTLTGGRTAQGERGGGAYGSGTTYLVDCVVSNNMAAGRGGAVNASVTSVRCRFVRNSAEEMAEVVYNGGTFFDCYFAENALERTSGNTWAIYTSGSSYLARLYNCTFAAGADQVSMRGATECYNCLFLCSTVGGTSASVLSKFYSCAFATAPSASANYVEIDDKCIVRNASKFPIDTEGRPLKGSECIDAGSNDLYTAAYQFQVGEYIDLCGTNRIWNGRIDIGCCEYIPSGKGFLLIYK